ncbi:hypothetical protein NP603_05125 [Methylomonas sp. SURF-1]|uniref:Uncharacterized protein n=1 Tax=Methylomonas aurea TaxID=2952224 RepID=A0ABT1UE18_9GAMM|nr:hypothetical protein [Methylomonas sp. SURF-1]MCQ8180480.1 hypothetical protein [Methylomonas sp. SURF-1]
MTFYLLVTLFISLTPMVACSSTIYDLRLWNVDDYFSATLSNVLGSDQQLLFVNYQGDSGYVDITNSLSAGINTIHLELINYGSGWTYSYDFRSNGISIDTGTCGLAGSVGCTDGDPSGVMSGVRFSKDIQVNIAAVPLPTTSLLFSAALLGLGLLRKAGNT